jgi:hypothetical protein
MGVTIEQYRARIGVHNINVRIKQDSTHHEASINSGTTMLMLLFQLVIRFLIFIVLSQVFYLCMLCLPLKWSKEPYKNFSQVVLSFTQKSCYNIYVPMLLDNYVCSQCSRDKKSPKKFSVENLMIPSSVPHELQDLTQVEEMF